MLTLNKEQLLTIVSDIKFSDWDNITDIVLESPNLSTLELTLWFKDGKYETFKMDESGRHKK